MNNNEFLYNAVQSLDRYWTPFVMVGSQINLALINMVAQRIGKITSLVGTTIVDDCNANNTYEDSEESLCCGLTFRLFDNGLLVVGEPDQDKWYEKGIEVDLSVVLAMKEDDFRQPDTH